MKASALAKVLSAEDDAVAAIEQKIAALNDEETAALRRFDERRTTLATDLAVHQRVRDLLGSMATNGQIAPSNGTGKRAPQGSWLDSVNRLSPNGSKDFSYQDLQSAMAQIGFPQPATSVRVRVSKFKRSGILEQVRPGRYRLSV